MEFLDLEVQRALAASVSSPGQHGCGDDHDDDGTSASPHGDFELHGWRRLLLRAMFRPHVAFYGSGGVSILRAAAMNPAPNFNASSIGGGGGGATDGAAAPKVASAPDALSVGAWLQVSATPSTMTGMPSADASVADLHGEEPSLPLWRWRRPRRRRHRAHLHRRAARRPSRSSCRCTTTPCASSSPGVGPRVVLNTQSLASTRGGAWFHLVVVIVKQTVTVSRQRRRRRPAAEARRAHRPRPEDPGRPGRAPGHAPPLGRGKQRLQRRPRRLALAAPPPRGAPRIAASASPRRASAAPVAGPLATSTTTGTGGKASGPTAMHRAGSQPPPPRRRRRRRGRRRRPP